MEQKLKRIYVMAAMVVLTAAAFFLRMNQPADQAGPLAWLSVVVLAVFALYACSLRPGKTWPFEGSNVVIMLLSLAAAGLTMGAAFLRFSNGAKLLMTALAALTALCWAVIALKTRNGKPSPWLYMLPVLFFGAELVEKFRSWGTDPQILDYCYALLALIATMCAVFHLGGFCFGKGQRRTTVFFCLSGMFFNGAALADASGDEMCLKLAALLWLAVNLWQLLQPRRKKTAEAAS